MLQQRSSIINTLDFARLSIRRQASAAGPSTSARRDYLRATFPSSVDLLYRRRAAQIGDGIIDDYVALHWLEWNGGALRVTVTGQNICDQINAETREPSDD